MDTNIPDIGKKRIVIVGGGFGGIELINKLKKNDFQIVLIDKNNYHQFPPLLYQVATAGLEANSISFPFRKMFQRIKHFYFRLADVKAIVAEQNLIQTSIGDIKYDYLVLAAGSETNFYGNQQMAELALPMKSVVEALELRNTLLSHFEKATLLSDPKEKLSYMNVVVVGGGATGVEIAGALAEMKRFIIPKDYPELVPYQLNIYLVEGTDRLLGPMTPESSEHAEKFLHDMGVIIMLNKKVTGYDGEQAELDDGSKIRTKTLVWVSGVKATTFGNISKEMLNRGGRIMVNEYNQVNGWKNVYAIGDICFQTEENYPNGHPQVAQVSIQHGKLLAKNLLRMEKGESPEPFHYKDLGTLATIGRNKAVADLKKLKLHGFSAWFIWLFVHLRSILGVRNKVMILIDWVWSYFTYDQSERFIIAVPDKDKAEDNEEKKDHNV